MTPRTVSTLPLGALLLLVPLALGCGGGPQDPGAKGYVNQCAYCHHVDGIGTRTGPPLREPWLRTEPLARVILHGVEGPITIDGVTHTRAMVGLGARLSDTEVAAIMTHVQRSFGKAGDTSPAVTPEEVQAIRGKAGSRTAPWQVSELQPLLR